MSSSSARRCRTGGRRTGGHGLSDGDLLVHGGSGSTATGVGPDEDDLRDSAGAGVDDGSAARTRGNTSESTTSGTLSSTLVFHSPRGVDVVDGLCESQGRNGQGQSC